MLGPSRQLSPPGAAGRPAVLLHSHGRPQRSLARATRLTSPKHRASCRPSGGSRPRLGRPRRVAPGHERPSLAGDAEARGGRRRHPRLQAAARHAPEHLGASPRLRAVDICALLARAAGRHPWAPDPPSRAALSRRRSAHGACHLRPPPTVRRTTSRPAVESRSAPGLRLPLRPPRRRAGSRGEPADDVVGSVAACRTGLWCARVHARVGGALRRKFGGRVADPPTPAGTTPLTPATASGWASA